MSSHPKVGSSALRNNILHDSVADGASLADLLSFQASLYSLRYDRELKSNLKLDIKIFEDCYSLPEDTKQDTNCSVNLHHTLVFVIKRKIKAHSWGNTP